VEHGVARVVAAMRDPDPRTDGCGLARLAAAGIATTCEVRPDEARRAIAGFLTRRDHGRPHVTLKLATSLDGCIALADGTSRWITGAAARAHAHLERSRHEAILVGRGTFVADAPALDVRLPGLEQRSPRRILLSRTLALGQAPAGWQTIGAPGEIAALAGVDHLLVEGGAETAAAFVAADLVDRLLVYRAPILIGGGKPALSDIGLAALGTAHARWVRHDRRMLGSDTLEVYERS
jgi:diaminohydroxyphosphoribosylaminopyrimidine deaminase/5-amino-6-(5-phosphoribosylamino)uracil reductase